MKLRGTLYPYHWTSKKANMQRHDAIKEFIDNQDIFEAVHVDSSYLAGYGIGVLYNGSKYEIYVNPVPKSKYKHTASFIEVR